MGIGGALQVARTAVLMLSISVVNKLQTNCHCIGVNWLLDKSWVSSSIWLKCCSKNIVWNLSRFALGMGLSIRGGARKG